jgi:histone chaperone ASF1
LDSVLIGPVAVGLNKFVFEAVAPDIQKLPKHEWIGTTVVLLQCAYRDQVFFRVGYFVMNEYTGGELIEAPESIAAREEKFRKLTEEAKQKIASGELTLDDDDDDMEIEPERAFNGEEGEEREEDEEAEELAEDEMNDLIADDDDLDDLSDSEVEGEEEEEEEEEEEDDTPGGKRPPAGKGPPGGKHPPTGGKQPPSSTNGSDKTEEKTEEAQETEKTTSTSPTAKPTSTDATQSAAASSSEAVESNSYVKVEESTAPASAPNPKKRTRDETITTSNGDGNTSEDGGNAVANGETAEELEKLEPSMKKRLDPAYLIQKYITMHLEDGGCRWYLNVDPHLIQRNVLMDQPRVTLFTIQW